MYNVAFVGCGRVSDLHALGYKNLSGARLYGLCDLDRSRAEARGREWGVTKIYRSYGEVLDDPEVQIVEILTPHHLHCTMTEEAARAGKHVSVQKPMALNLQEADRMIEAAARGGVMLRIYENFVYYPPYVRAKELIEAGEIGEPLTFNLRVRCGTGQGQWDVPLEAWAWRINPEMGGGCPLMFDHNYHNYSLALYLLGPVGQVAAWMDRSELVPGSGIFVSTPSTVMWKYRKGGMYGVMDVALGPELQIDTRYYADESRLEITGTRGIIFVNRCTGRLQNRPALELYRDGVTTAYEHIPCEWDCSFAAATEDLILSLERGVQPKLSGTEGRAALELTLAAIESAEKGEQVLLPDPQGSGDEVL